MLIELTYDFYKKINIGLTGTPVYSKKNLIPIIEFLILKRMNEKASPFFP